MWANFLLCFCSVDQECSKRRYFPCIWPWRLFGGHEDDEHSDEPPLKADIEHTDHRRVVLLVVCNE